MSDNIYEDHEVQELIAQLPASAIPYAFEFLAYVSGIHAALDGMPIDSNLKMKVREHGSAIFERYEAFEKAFVSQTRANAITIVRTRKQTIKNDKSTLYILGVEDNPELYKIGVTNNIETRLTGLRHQSALKPYVVKLILTPYAKSLEKALFTAFAGKRTHGEWFKFTDEDLIDVFDATETLLEEIVGLPDDTAPVPARSARSEGR